MRAFSGLVTLLAVLNISWAAYIWSLWGADTAYGREFNTAHPGSLANLSARKYEIKAGPQSPYTQTETNSGEKYSLHSQYLHY